MKYRFDPRMDSPSVLGRRLARICRGTMFDVVCVGTDRSTGDALGPLTGSLLEEEALSGLRVWGTVDSPIHAANLESFIADFDPSLPVLAVDACLGPRRYVGTVSLAEEPLRPGAGVNKRLPSVGTMHITGTVNMNGFMEFYILQNTRLSRVMRMARWVASGIMLATEWIRQGAPRGPAAGGVSD